MRVVKVVYNNVSMDDNVLGSLSVYPNPSNGKIYINLAMATGEEAVVSIVNLLGEEIMTLNSGKLTTDKFTVDMSSYAAGIYLVKVQTAKETILERVVLTK